jgi:hypothetical protein
MPRRMLCVKDTVRQQALRLPRRISRGDTKRFALVQAYSTKLHIVIQPVPSLPEDQHLRV